MEKEKFSLHILETPVQDLPVLFGHAFSNEISKTHPIISTFKWRVHSGGFKIHPTVTNISKNNPRKTGEWKFSIPANYHKKWVAVEYLKCISCGDCSIKLRLKYNAQKCVIQSNASSHSLLPFKKEIKIYQPVPQQIKKEIIEMRNFSLIKMKPAHVYANLVGKYPQALVPIKNQLHH